MRPLTALIIYIVVVFVGGALLAPWVHWMMQPVGRSIPLLADAPFHRYVHRCFLILALAGLWPLLRALGIKSVQDVGLVPPREHWQKWLTGFAIGLLSLAIIAFVSVQAGARRWNYRIPGDVILVKALTALATALIVGFMEEILFRGGLFGGLRKVINWKSALAVSSLIYASTHFFAPVKHAGSVQWDSGLALLPGMMSDFTKPEELIPGFINLVLVGVILALAFQRTGNLYFSLGLHTGWIFWLKLSKTVLVHRSIANTTIHGTASMIDGWLATGALIMALILTLKLTTILTRRPPS